MATSSVRSRAQRGQWRPRSARRGARVPIIHRAARLGGSTRMSTSTMPVSAMRALAPAPAPPGARAARPAGGGGRRPPRRAAARAAVTPGVVGAAVDLGDAEVEPPDLAGGRLTGGHAPASLEQPLDVMRRPGGNPVLE